MCVVSVGMDLNIEVMVVVWFVNFGFCVFEGVMVMMWGVWGGMVCESDVWFVMLYCLDVSTNMSVLEDYDFVGWLLVLNVIEDVMSDCVDFKVVLFEMMVMEWWEYARTRAESAKALGDACGCGVGVMWLMVLMCGNEDYYYCDIYLCVWECVFGSVMLDEETWKIKYIERVREIKFVASSGRLLMILMIVVLVGYVIVVKILKFIV